MKKFSLLTLLIFVLVSCSDRCAECEEKLLDCVKNQIIPVDVPESKELKKSGSVEFVTVRVTEQESYIIDDQEYVLDSLSKVIETKVNDSGTKKLKIQVDKEALYRPVFKLLAIVQIRGLDPILSYSEN